MAVCSAVPEAAKQLEGLGELGKLHSTQPPVLRRRTPVKWKGQGSVSPDEEESGEQGGKEKSGGRLRMRKLSLQ